jgi:phage FluMu protein Com
MAKARRLFAAPTRITFTYSYVKLLRCPDCNRLLRASGGSEKIPTFHCGRCHHTWNWLARDARRVVIKVMHAAEERRREGRPLTRWRT